MGVKNLFIAAVIPVLKVLIVTAVGSFLAIQRVGILNKAARIHLNILVFYVLSPTFVYTNLSKSVTLKSVALMWYMPINIFLTFFIGSILGWAVIQITKPPPRLKGLILGCCAGGNLGNMLIIIVPAICKEKDSPFGSRDVCLTNGLAYATLSMAIGAIFLWLYVYNIIRISSSKVANDDSENGNLPITDTPEETSKTLPGPNIGGPISTQDSTTTEHLEDQHAAPSSRVDEMNAQPKASIPVKLGKILKMILEKLEWKKLFAPTTIGVIIGYFIALIAPIKNVLIPEGAPLHVLQDSVAFLGDATIPAATLIMGGNLVKGISKSAIRVSYIIGIIAVRYIALPLLGVAIVKGAVRYGLLQKDPLYQFILHLQFALPPAMTIGTMTQLFGVGESECSVIFLWTYVLSVASLTLWSAFFMWLVS